VYEYDLIDQAPENDCKRRGVLAHELGEVVPGAVSEDANGHKTIDLYAMVATLWGSVQELSAEVARLKGNN